VVWIPFGATMTTDPTNCCINVIHDLATARDLQVGVGYARDRPYLNADLLTPYITPNFETACNGQLSIRVVNPLLCTADTSPVTLLIFARSKNMSFGVPRDFFRYIQNTTDGLEDVDKRTRVFYQGALGDDDNAGPMIHDLIAPSGPYPVAELFFGEDIQSVRALMQKPSLLDPLTLTDSNESIRFTQLGGFNSTSVWSWARSLSLLFTGLATSERYKVFTESEAWVGVAPVLLGSFTAPATTYTPSLSPMSFVGANRGMEVSVPYYLPKKYLLTRDQSIPQPGTRVNMMQVYRDTAASDSTRGVVYHSYGPDIRVTCFRCVPAVGIHTLATATAPTTWWFDNPT